MASKDNAKEKDKQEKAHVSLLTVALDLSDKEPDSQQSADDSARARILEFVEMNGRTDEVYKKTAEGIIFADTQTSKPIIDQKQLERVIGELLRGHIFRAVGERRAQTEANRVRHETLQRETL